LVFQLDVRIWGTNAVAMKSRLVVGCMTGTSLDGLDVALVRIEGARLAARVEVLGTMSRGFDETDGFAVLRGLANGESVTSGQIANASVWFSRFHAKVIQELLGKAGGTRADLISVHGQTVFHGPPASWQLFNPWPLARVLGSPVVFDLRGADLAAGGQGAPITPLADWVLFRTPLHPVTVVNLGGFCNITWLPTTTPGREEAELRAIRARDVCACNQVLDGVARAVLGASYDKGGAAAERGEPDETALEQILNLLGAQSGSGRSLGTGDEARVWIDTWKSRLGAEDLAATAAAGVGMTIARSAVSQEGALAVLAGGGAKNRAVRAHIETLVPISRQEGSRQSMVDYREAVAMAVLGALCQDGVPITLPQVTGVPAPAPVAGCWVQP
jgi:1,6-anhydro-N-acetylmuramate kinase